MLQRTLAYAYILQSLSSTHGSAWADNDAGCQRLPEPTRRAWSCSASVTSTAGAHQALTAKRRGSSSERPRRRLRVLLHQAYVSRGTVGGGLELVARIGELRL
jgi:hypothetical protein